MDRLPDRRFYRLPLQEESQICWTDATYKGGVKLCGTCLPFFPNSIQSVEDFTHALTCLFTCVPAAYSSAPSDGFGDQNKHTTWETLPVITRKYM